MFDRMMGAFLRETRRLTSDQLQTVYDLQSALRESELKDGYKSFIQALSGSGAGLMTDEQIEAALSEYKDRYRRTDEEMEILKADNTDEIVSMHLDMTDERIRLMTIVNIRNLQHLVDRHLYLGRSVNTGYAEGEVFAGQTLCGGMDVLAAMCGSYDAMRTVAEHYVGASNIETKEDVLDAICELINTSNGMFVREHIGEDEELEPPSYRTEPYMIEGAEIYVMPLYLCGVTIDYCIARGASQDQFRQGLS